jgi:hypothetical protein
MIIDHILCAKPIFIEYLVAAYAVMKVEVIHDHNVLCFLRKATQMYEKGIKKSTTKQTDFSPLPKGHYPVLDIVQKSPMWREKELQRIRAEAEVVKQQMALAEQIEKESAKIEAQRKKWLRERASLKQVEQEQFEEFRRRERQNILRQAKREKRLAAVKRDRLLDRKRTEEAEINKWREEVEEVRREICENLAMTKENWVKWLKLKEDSLALARDEVGVDLHLLDERGEAQIEAIEAQRATMADTAKEEDEMLASALEESRKLDDERIALRERLDQAKRQHVEGFQALRRRK